jgi:hypothetical protein
VGILTSSLFLPSLHNVEGYLHLPQSLQRTIIKDHSPSNPLCPPYSPFAPYLGEIYLLTYTVRAAFQLRRKRNSKHEQRRKSMSNDSISPCRYPLSSRGPIRSYAKVSRAVACLVRRTVSFNHGSQHDGITRPGNDTSRTSSELSQH